MNREYILNLLILASICMWCIYTNNRIAEYQGSKYEWEKLLGKSEKRILIEFQKENILVQGLALIFYAVITVSHNVLIWLLGIFNFILLINNIIMLIFRKKYHGNLSGKLFMAGMYAYFVWIFYTFIQQIIEGGSAYEIVVHIINSLCIRNVVGMVKQPPVFIVLVNIIVFAYLFLTLPQYNDRVCSNYSKIRIKRHINLTKNIAMLLVLYSGYIFLGINISYNQNFFSVITGVFIIILSGTIDDSFHEDVCNKQWYKLLGEKYSCFLRKKMIEEIQIQFVIVITYLICALINRYDISIVCMIMIYNVSCGICWVTYFSSYYVNMQRNYMTFEMIKLYVIMIVAAMPVLNIILSLYWYVCGTLRWNKYVRDY